ncbi:baseplate J/gp47 family protein [Vibrio rumoiensis]|uniref:Baseplate J/gp47 family protein n=1 Tax=Vibrio rumoiensis TaxID=76258 RepID=A0ABW7J1E3_9VIBR
MSVPQAFTIPNFEDLFAEFKQAAVDYVAQTDSDKAASLEQAFANESELLSQVMASSMIKHQAMLREQNYWALQMFRKFVTEADMVDLLALQYGLNRQTVKEADDSVFPPVEAEMESNEDLLRRFDLAPYQFHTTGTRQGYKFHALTLDARPYITIESEEAAVTMRFEFPTEQQPVPVKDAAARMLSANTGKVEVAILSRENPDGTASDELLERVSNYLNRDDIAQESDDITVKSVTPKPYTINAVCYTDGDPNNDVSEEDAVAAVQAFVDSEQKLEGRIDRLELGHVIYELGYSRVELTSPAADVVCEWDEAPYCTEVTINVKAE